LIEEADPRYIRFMEWTVSPPDEGGYENVILRGDCDLYAAPPFAAAMRERIVAGSRKIRLDLEGVDYLDSTGVGAIIRILQEARKIGGEIRFRGVGGSPRKVLKMSNILSLMKEDAPARRAGGPALPGDRP
jgi:anti-anti-sigma factor